MRNYTSICCAAVTAALLILLNGCTIQINEPVPPPDPEAQAKSCLVGTWETPLVHTHSEDVMTVYKFGANNELDITNYWYALDTYYDEWVLIESAEITGPDDYYYLDNGYVKMHLEDSNQEYWAEYEMDEDDDVLLLYVDALVGVEVIYCAKGTGSVTTTAAPSRIQLTKKSK